MRLILLGAPGAGKGTQGVRLARHYGVAHVASGDLLREHVATETPLGKRVATFLAEGALVPDDLVLSVVGQAVREAMETGGYLLDGFPRTLAQAERAFEIATRDDLTADAVLFLEISDEEAVQRLVARSATSGRVDDASVDVIRHRLEVFHEQTVPLLDFYESHDRLVRVDAGGPPDDVFAEIVERVEARSG